MLNRKASFQEIQKVMKISKSTLSFHLKKMTESDMLMRFIAPADVAGTGFLVIEHANRDDDRYLYLPALRRTKRIASSGKGGNFMGSDYTYYDIGEPKLDDWTYPEVEADTLDGIACYRITALPATPQIEKDTGYSKLVHWVRKDRMSVIKTEYYDRRGKLLKVLTIPEMVQLEGVWFQSHLVMKNVQDNRTSEMRFENIKINTGLSADLFSKRRLERRMSCPEIG
jgi:outer membrane lipoprotein-sorting protein